jgi:hypothetical protein
MWAIQAILYTCYQFPEYQTLSASFQKLCTDIYSLVCLQRDEFFDDRVMRAFEALNGRFAKPLCLDTEIILQSHSLTVKALQAHAA